MSSNSLSLKQLALQKFKRNFWGVFSFYFILLVGFISVFAYLLAPDDSQYANQMHLSIHSKKPGFKVKMLIKPSQLKVSQNPLDKVFFGKKNTDTEIPVSDFEIEGMTLRYTEYASDGLKGVEKTIQINSADKLSPFVKDKTFYFGTDKYGRDLLILLKTILFFLHFHDYIQEQMEYFYL